MGEGSLHPHPKGWGIRDPPRSLCIKVLDAEVSGDRLVTFLDEQRFNESNIYEFRNFLETLDGIEFGQVTFDEHEEFGASFLNSKENSDKIEAAGYSLMISDKISEK